MPLPIVNVINLSQEEAIAGRARMSNSTACLLPELVNDPSVKPPYSNTQIRESAMHAQTLHIYETARPQTRMYYELGHYRDGDSEENWVIKWLLWHVFRYRDNRNRGRSVASNSPGHRASALALAEPPSSLPKLTEASLLANSRLSVPYMGQVSPPPDATLASTYSPRSTSLTNYSTTAARAPIRDQYWDPVRDAQATNDSSRSHSSRS